MQEEFKTAYKFAKESMISELIISGKGGINNMYQDIEDIVGKISVNRQVIRKSYFISVELIENVIKYGVLNESFENRFLLGYDNARFYFLSANLVPNQEINYIQQKIDGINAVFEKNNTKELLREMYKNKLRGLADSEKTVKIGIINLARKLEEKILYNFEKVDDNYSVFSIICTVDDKES